MGCKSHLNSPSYTPASSKKTSCTYSRDTVMGTLQIAAALLVLWNFQILKLCEGLPQSAIVAAASDPDPSLIGRASHACLPSSPEIPQDLHLTAKETEMLRSLCQRTDLTMPQMVVQDLRRSIPAGVVCNATDWWVPLDCNISKHFVPSCSH